MPRACALSSSSATTALRNAPLALYMSRTMLSVQPNAFHFMHSSNAPSRPPSRMGYRIPGSSKIVLNPPPAYPHAPRPVDPANRRSRTRSSSDATHLSSPNAPPSGSLHPNLDEDIVIYRTNGLVTTDDLPHKPCSTGRNTVWNVAPIGTGRAHSTRPPSPAQGTTQAQTGWFAPPGLPPPDRARMLQYERAVSRTASAPPYAHHVPRSTFYEHTMSPSPSNGVEVIDLTGSEEHCAAGGMCELNVASKDPDECLDEKFISFARLPPKEIKGPFARTPDDVLRERPPFGYVCPPSIPFHLTQLITHNHSTLGTKCAWTWNASARGADTAPTYAAGATSCLPSSDDGSSTLGSGTSARTSPIGRMRKTSASCCPCRRRICKDTLKPVRTARPRLSWHGQLEPASSMVFSQRATSRGIGIPTLAVISSCSRVEVCLHNDWQ